MPYIYGHRSSDNRCSSIIVDNKSYIIIENLYVEIMWRISNGRGINLLRGSNNSIIGCTISGSIDQDTVGILNWGCTNPTIQNNIIHGCQYGIHIDTPDGVGYPGLVENNICYDIIYGTATDWDGIKIGRNPGDDFTGFTVRGNEIYSFNEDGIDAFYADNIVIENNYIHDVDTRKNNDNQSGIKTVANGVIIRYNKICNIQHSTINNRYGINAEGDDLQIYYNLIYNTKNAGILIGPNLTSCSVYNNTVSGCGNGLEIQGNTSITVQNNILDGITDDLNITVSGTVVTGGYNLLANDPSPNIGSGVTYSGVEHDIYGADPLFDTDYTLLSGSPAINVGINVGLSVDLNGISVPSGYSTEIGAYEYYQPYYSITPDTVDIYLSPIEFSSIDFVPMYSSSRFRDTKFRSYITRKINEDSNIENRIKNLDSEVILLVEFKSPITRTIYRNSRILLNNLLN